MIFTIVILRSLFIKNVITCLAGSVVTIFPNTGTVVVNNLLTSVVI